MELVMQILIGLGLATACGFRVFVPLWALSLFSLTGKIELVDSFNWIGTTPAFIIFSVALVIEIMVYYIPVLDNAMDVISTPVSVIASAVVVSSYVDGIDPLLKYSLLLIASSSITLVVKSIMSGVRGVSTTTTAGLGNGLVSTGEWILAILLSVGAILFPLLSILFIIIVVWMIRKRKKKRKENGAN